MWGVDRLGQESLAGLLTRLREAPFAVLTHAAAVDRRGRGLLEVLAGLGLSPQIVFSPEHGLDGVAQAEEPVPSEERAEGPRVMSLYGATRESLSPSPDDLQGVNTLLIDLVDVGARYYTYVWTALLAARVAAERGIHTVALDRPNPLGGLAEAVEGRSQEPGFLSFVGLEPVPIRHGLTLGEVLALCFQRDRRELGPEGALSLVGCRGWERARTALFWQRPFVPPSPNMPTAETALLYPGGCLVEGTNLSEGRGTAFPFRAIGAPFLDGEALAKELRALELPGLMVRPVAFRPSFEKHADHVCRGVMLHVTEPHAFQPVRTYLGLLTLARQQAPAAFRFLDRVYEFESEVCAFDLLCGRSSVREAMLAGASPADVAELVCPVRAEERELPALAETLAAEAAR